jgi:hypothetical protein
VTHGSTATADLRLHIRLSTFRVRLRDNGNTLVPGATVQLEQGDQQLTATPVEGAPGNYLFNSMVPGNYTLSASGAGLIASTVAIEIVPGGGAQEFTMIVSRASNTLIGTARETQSGAVIPGATARVLCPAEPGATTPCTDDGVVMGTNGQPVSGTTGADGAFSMRNVPNGDFRLEISKHGFTTKTVGPLTFSHLQGALPSQNLTLDVVTRPVEITVSSTHSQDTGRGTIGVQLTQPGQPAQTVQLTHQSAGTYTGRLDQVRFGCWSLAVDIAANTGTLGAPDFSGPADPQLGCAAGRLVVPGVPQDPDDAEQPVLVDYELQTALVEVTSATTPIEGHDAPTDPQLQIGRGGTVWHTSAATIGGTVRFWAPPGAASVTLTAGSPASVFWPAVSSGSLTLVSGGTSEVDLTLVESSGVVTLGVSGTPALPSGTVVTVEVEAGPSQSADLPSGYDSVTFTGASRSFTLPSGEWRVTVSAPGYEPVTRTWNVTALTQSESVSLTAVPPESEEDPLRLPGG